MSELAMDLDKGSKGIRKTSSVHPYESAWLGRWTQLGNEVKFQGHSKDESKCVKEVIRPEDCNVKESHGVEVLPFPIFKVSQNKESTTTKLQGYPVLQTYQSFNDNVSSSSKAMYPQREKISSSNCLDFTIQEKRTQNLLELIRPLRIYATVDSINLPEEDGHQLLKGSTVSMKLKGKIVGGYLDLFHNLDHCHNKGGARLESLESSKNTEEDAETDIFEKDRYQAIQLSDGYQGETSNSATQNMNVEQFLPRVRLESEAELSSSWVKRLKKNALDSSGHDESKRLMKIKEVSPAQKGNNNLFLEILKFGVNNLQPRNQEPVTSQIKNLNQEGEDIKLLHPWIQRWCKKKASSTDQPGGQDASFETENQKEIEKKHLPSIAAMALMGKVLSGLNPYALRKTESLMVWNAQDLR